MRVIYRHLRYEIDETTKEAVLLGTSDFIVEEDKRTRLRCYDDYRYRYYPGHPVDIVVPSRFTKKHISYTVVGIAEDAFSNISFLKSITLPSTIRTIGKRAFTGCQYLQSIVISPENKCFSSEGNVILDRKSKTLRVGILSSRVPEGTKVIGERAFFDQENLDLLYLPSSVKKIGKEAFAYCSQFSGFSICPIRPRNLIADPSPRKGKCSFPNHLEEISDDAFQDCVSLTHLSFPRSVRKIAETAFEGCCKLVSIQAEEDNPVYEAKENCLIEKKDQVLVLGSDHSRIPDGVTRIASHSFSHRYLSSQLRFPSSLKTISSYAFENCINLRRGVLLPGIEEIGDGAFSGCMSLMRVSLPERLKRLGKDVFEACESLERVKLPSTMEKEEDRNMVIRFDQYQYVRI